MGRVRGSAIASCLTEVYVGSQRLDLLPRWQHVLFPYTARALTVWKPEAKQTDAAVMPGISRSRPPSPFSNSLAHKFTCLQYIEAVTVETHHPANTFWCFAEHLHRCSTLGLCSEMMQFFLWLQLQRRIVSPLNDGIQIIQSGYLQSVVHHQ